MIFKLYCLLSCYYLTIVIINLIFNFSKPMLFISIKLIMCQALNKNYINSNLTYILFLGLYTSNLNICVFNYNLFIFLFNNLLLVFLCWLLNISSRCLKTLMWILWTRISYLLSWNRLFLFWRALISIVIASLVVSFIVK